MVFYKCGAFHAQAVVAAAVRAAEGTAVGTAAAAVTTWGCIRHSCGKLQLPALCGTFAFTAEIRNCNAIKRDSKSGSNGRWRQLCVNKADMLEVLSCDDESTMSQVAGCAAEVLSRITHQLTHQSYQCSCAAWQYAGGTCPAVACRSVPPLPVRLHRYLTWTWCCSACWPSAHNKRQQQQQQGHMNTTNINTSSSSYHSKLHQWL